MTDDVYTSHSATSYAPPHINITQPEAGKSQQHAPRVQTFTHRDTTGAQLA